MRCFIAFDIPEEIKEKVKEIQENIKWDFAKISFVKEIHCTLRFLGEIKEKDVDYLKEELSKLKFKNFNVEIDEFIYFPNDKKIRVIGLNLKSGKLYELKEKIDGLIKEKFGKDRKFKAHLTIGRVKFIKDREELMKRLKTEKLKFLVDKIILYKSELLNEGAKHTKLLEINLL